MDIAGLKVRALRAQLWRRPSHISWVSDSIHLRQPVDHFHYEACQVPLRQPLIYRRWQQEPVSRLIGPKLLIDSPS
jgi:hypothetical protein